MIDFSDFTDLQLQQMAVGGDRGAEEALAGRCLRLRRIGLTVDGERIAVDIFLLPSMDDFQTFCAFERLAP